MGAYLGICALALILMWGFEDNLPEWAKGFMYVGAFFGTAALWVIVSQWREMIKEREREGRRNAAAD
ncbi:hypothetical protein ACU610_00700 [Geodermatophilus sp. URMC 61]|uniref:hypothetical protein n=1 Tax=Geodermatophilus sp. URMC 61 TaxID=3423411 RepID=UPI00406C384F